MLSQLDNRVNGTIRSKVPQADALLQIINAPKIAKQNDEQSFSKVQETYNSVPEARSVIDSLIEDNIPNIDIIEYLKHRGLTN